MVVSAERPLTWKVSGPSWVIVTPEPLVIRFEPPSSVRLSAERPKLPDADAVITDVIMPDQDGYSVCTQVKQHPQFAHIPVVLMSGVVNKTVADKAVAVHADELIRKPFQPQELIGRVKALLHPRPAASSTDYAAAPSHAAESRTALTSLFAPPPAPVSAPPPPGPAQVDSVWPRALADAFTPRPVPGLPGQHPQPPAVAGLQTSQPAQAPRHQLVCQPALRTSKNCAAKSPASNCW